MAAHPDSIAMPLTTGTDNQVYHLTSSIIQQRYSLQTFRDVKTPFLKNLLAEEVPTGRRFLRKGFLHTQNVGLVFPPLLSFHQSLAQLSFSLHYQGYCISGQQLVYVLSVAHCTHIMFQ